MASLVVLHVCRMCLDRFPVAGNLCVACRYGIPANALDDMQHDIDLAISEGNPEIRQRVFESVVKHCRRWRDCAEYN